MNTKISIFIVILLCNLLPAHAQVNRYWVGSSIYRNSLTSSSDLLDWTLTNDNGTGSWTTSGTGSSILKTDDAAGLYANKLLNTSGGSPRLLMLDPYDGTVELQTLALSTGTQFSIQVEEYDASNVLLTTIDIFPWQSNSGFYTIYLGDYSFDPSATQIRFIISLKNTSSVQGTLELNYFNYFNSYNGWSNSANWSATSGGAGNAGVPGTLDNVFFDANSVTNAIVDQPATVASITLTSTYKSGLINAGSNNFTVTGSSFLNGGFMVGVNDHLFVNDVTVAGTQFISTSGTITITGTLSYVSGNFKPANGTMIFTSSNAQIIPAINFNNLTLSGTGTKTATGNFSVAGNFVNNSTFNAAGNTILLNGTVGQTISGTSVTTLNNLTVSNNSSGGIVLSSQVLMTGVLSLQTGAKLTTNNNLTLLATSSTVFASIANLTGATITGNIKYQKYIFSSKRIYRYLSSPTATGTVADWQASIPITGTFANPSTGPFISSATPSMFIYNETTAGTKNTGYEAYPATGVSSSSAALVAGKGYSIFVRDNSGRPTVLEINGVLNRGTMNLSSLITYTSSGSPADDGWNLIGNPYPSSINWSAIAGTDRVNIDNAIYYTDNNSASPVYRSWVNGVGTNCTSGIISPMQGFWVKANGSGTPLLRIRESHKTSATPAFYRLADEIALLRICLDSTNSTFHDETVIRLTEEATADFDSEYDAYKLYDETHPAIGSLTSVSPLLSVNAFAQLADMNDTIPLFVKTISAGNYSLSVPEYTFDASMTAYLWDTYTDTKKQLLAGVIYSFEVSEDSLLKTNRFKILLNNNTLTTGVFTSSANADGLVLFPNPADQTRTITIRFPQAAGKPIQLQVYDVTGTLVYSDKDLSAVQSEYALTLPHHLTSGIYKINVRTNDGVYSSSTCIIK